MKFNYRIIFRTVSMLIFFEALLMIVPAITGFIMDESVPAVNFLILALIGIVAGFYGLHLTENYSRKIKTRESYFIVLVSWLTVILYGVFPYLLSGRRYSVTDCIFESVASWTTSSAWVVDINSMPRCLLLWKAMSNWFGGMGVVLITVLVLSSLGASGQKLLNAETGSLIEKTEPKIKDTVAMIFSVYAVISIVELILLMIGKIPLFDAVINTMTSVSTAGIMDYHGNVAAHFTPYVKVVLVIFSVIGALNFMIYIKLARRKFKQVFYDYEMRIFLAGLLASTAFIAIMLLVNGVYRRPFEAFINALLATVSFGCTTGFHVESFTLWPGSCKAMLYIMMITGGCANSTSGGLKVLRTAVFFKLIRRGFYKRIHPRAMKPVMIRDIPVSAPEASSISAYIMLFFTVYLFSTAIIGLQNMDMLTTLTSPMALITNTGTGLGQTATAGYGEWTTGGRLYASLLMLAGRLEIYPILIIFSKSFWNGDKAA